MAAAALGHNLELGPWLSVIEAQVGSLAPVTLGDRCLDVAVGAGR